jgi:hypothetical protein
MAAAWLGLHLQTLPFFGSTTGKMLDTAQSVITLFAVMNRIAALLLTLFASIAATSAQTPQAHSVPPKA